MEKIYAIGDIHGDIDRLKHLLQKYSIVDENDAWIAGESKIVFIGDLTDRGKHGIAVIHFLMNLQKQAQECGGDLISLCGNHDALILATAFEYRDEEAHYMCRELFRMNGGNIVEAIALSRDDEAFKWMQERPLMYKIQNILFQHADTCNFYSSIGDSVESVNEKGLESLQSAPGAFNIFYNMTDCRFFDRQHFSKEEEHSNHIDKYLQLFGVDTVVHGHTRFIGNAAQSYYNGKVLNIDGSLSNGYRNDENRGFILDFSEF